MEVQTTNFTHNIKTLLRLDDEIRVLQDQLKGLKKQKHDVQDQIMVTMVQRKWDKLTVDIGKFEMSMAEKKHYSSMSFSYLEKTLSQLIPEKTQLEYVLKHLKDNRNVKTTHEIVMAEKT
jgi:hypothetical protein